MDRVVRQHEREVHERRRAEIVATVPRRYSPLLHLLAPSLFGASVMGIAAWLLADVQPAQWLAFPLTLLGGWGFEWRVHKDVLHARRPGLGVLYERHELMHHVIYRREDMAMRSAQEAFLILMPPYAIVLVFGLVVPLALGLFLLLSANVALLFVIASMLFFLAYEWMHLAYHLPAGSRVGRSRLVGVLRELHARHHDPALMKRWNFNVTVPLFDWLHGSLWSPERARVRSTRAAPAEREEVRDRTV